MKLRVGLALLLTIFFASCHAATDEVIKAVSPSITGFSPDTAWTFKSLTIYGQNFGYDRADVPVTIDTIPCQVYSVNDTVMVVTVPEAAHTGFIHATKLNQTSTSSKKVAIQYTFNPHAIGTTVPLGGSFSIPGTGILNHHGPVHVFVGNIEYIVDSILPDRIVSHVAPNGITGSVVVTDDNGGHDAGGLTVSRYSPWRTMTATWDHVTMEEDHELKGYRNGPASTVDSTWTTTAVWNQQMSWDVSKILFSRNARGLDYAPVVSGYPNPQLTVKWDTIGQTLNFNFELYNYPVDEGLHALDTFWYIGYNYGSPGAMPMPVDRDIELPIQDFRYQINESNSDHQGLVSWSEVTNTRIVSGSFKIKLSR